MDNDKQDENAASEGTSASPCSMHPGIEQCAVVQGILYGTQRCTMAECRDLSVTLLAAIDIIDGRTTEASNAEVSTMNEAKRNECVAPPSCSVPDWIRAEVKATWTAMQGSAIQMEAYRIMERMVRRLGYGDLRDPSLAPNNQAQLHSEAE